MSSSETKNENEPARLDGSSSPDDDPIRQDVHVVAGVVTAAAAADLTPNPVKDK